MNKEGMTEEMQELKRLLGDSSSPVVTPDMLQIAAGWMMAKTRGMLDERPGAPGQEFGRVSDIARIYNVKRSTAHDWVCRLREKGKVRVQRPCSGAKGKGDTFYNLADIARAFEENANDGKH